MRSAPCASAPSHPLHAMPSRITRNSYRPRASDRTMVATENTSPACRVFQTRWHRHHQQRKLTRMDNKSQTSSGKPNQSGLDLEKTISLRSRRKFFLDIPFYRTRWHRHHQQRKLTRMDNKSQTSSGKPNQSGLDLEKTISLRSRRKFFLDIPFYRTRWHRHHQQRKLTRMDNKSQTSSGKPNQSGLDLEKTISLRSRRKFFLDIPFYRTH